MGINEADMTVSERFNALLSNLTLTTGQAADGATKHAGVRKCLNAHYYSSTSETANSRLVGSWGKGTRIRPSRDIDVLFILPYEVYTRFESRPGNKQSQLLQEVKGVLQKTYSTTTMRGDGQVVVIPFSSYAVELVPAFRLQSGQFWICDTNGGGKYKTIDPIAEHKAVSNSNSATNNNTRDLIRMMKRWQEYCNVPLKSFQLELLAIEFVKTWEHAGKSSVYYDYMVRDFLKVMVGQANGYVFVPGTSECVRLGGAWLSRAKTARDRAVNACSYEARNMPYSAGSEWQKIFGDYIPTG